MAWFEYGTSRIYNEAAGSGGLSHGNVSMSKRLWTFAVIVEVCGQAEVVELNSV